ncbi:Ribokinase [Alphaproteobacteria bacterium SO-S41]|nr:Ribokinase [Alphaproteobacteria bacterium SO-S41]
MSARLTVVGSVNLDIVATGARLPAPGETVTDAELAFHPGGKGANQALAARRLGAEVALIARVGRDANADAALALLKAEGVDLSGVGFDDAALTGVALIAVAAGGENQIVVASGANRTLTPAHVTLGEHDGVLCQMEVPPEVVAAVAERCKGFFAVNLAPALPAPALVFERADLIIVNEGEAAAYGSAIHGARGLVAITYGAKGAALFRGARKIAEAAPPAVTPIDTTGAGDCFAAALMVALIEGLPKELALRFACAAGAAATTRAGAQTALPTRAEVEALAQLPV